MFARLLSWAEKCVFMLNEGDIYGHPLVARGYPFSKTVAKHNSWCDTGETGLPRKTHRKTTPTKTPRLHHSGRDRIIVVGTSTNDNSHESSRDHRHCSSASEVDEDTCESLDSLGRLTLCFAQSAETTSHSVFSGISVPAFL